MGAGGGIVSWRQLLHLSCRDLVVNEPIVRDGVWEVVVGVGVGLWG